LSDNKQLSFFSHFLFILIKKRGIDKQDYFYVDLSFFYQLKVILDNQLKYKKKMLCEVCHENKSVPYKCPKCRIK